MPPSDVVRYVLMWSVRVLRKVRLAESAFGSTGTGYYLPFAHASPSLQGRARSQHCSRRRYHLEHRVSRCPAWTVGVA